MELDVELEHCFHLVFIFFHWHIFYWASQLFISLINNHNLSLSLSASYSNNKQNYKNWENTQECIPDIGDWNMDLLDCLYIK